ncbi:MAG TPA: Rrf2 family transcriptional regulator [Acidobacteriota bacterium]|jgi:Rrf2 family protein|nr:Rrf2 family transcriptional regulator [Acidobacteriota bacterium]
MNISTRSEYGLRALIYIARHSAIHPVSAREISAAWHVPVKYLEQILKLLKDAGIVDSRIGLGGGYRLARPAALITAGEVIRVLDGRIAPFGCVSETEYLPCEFEVDCGLQTLWARTRQAILSIVDHTTIADLARPVSESTATSKPVSLRKQNER